MAYKKGNHCNNNCAHFFGEDVTIYDPYHGGNPGSTDYEQYQMYCCAKVADGERIYKVRYGCPIYQAANTACSGRGWAVAIFGQVTPPAPLTQTVRRPPRQQRER